MINSSDESVEENIVPFFNLISEKISILNPTQCLKGYVFMCQGRR